jgi:hypothetical protein
MKLTNKQKNEIFMAICEASMSWKETPKGEFDGTNAARIGIDLISVLEN